MNSILLEKMEILLLRPINKIEQKKKEYNHSTNTVDEKILANKYRIMQYLPISEGKERFYSV